MLLALPYPTTNFLPFYAAEDLGFFSRAGVGLHCIHVGETKERKVRLCLAGDLDFYTSISTTVEAVLRGWGDVKALCSNQTTLYFCAARQEIAELNDLQGKRVMVGGGASNNQITYLSKKLGWILGSDITIVRGDALDRIRAFEGPAIAAVIAREEYAYWAVKAGWRLIRVPGRIYALARWGTLYFHSTHSRTAGCSFQGREGGGSSHRLFEPSSSRSHRAGVQTDQSFESRGR
jgi:ABC-type nitrate/sulfonate/bicarbonate transport system substrate-binding protein